MDVLIYRTISLGFLKCSIMEKSVSLFKKLLSWMFYIIEEFHLVFLTIVTEKSVTLFKEVLL